MDTAGQKLKRSRERLGLRYREVEEASQRIAERQGNPEFAIALSRLADIENKGTVPSIFRLYSLCAIYRLELNEVLGWYGVRPSQLPLEAAGAELPATHIVPFPAPAPPDTAWMDRDGPLTDAVLTRFAGQLEQWGKRTVSLLREGDARHHRYGYIGLDDWTMYPLLPPGSLVVIDERQRKIATSGWSSEYDRPLYFLEHRGGFACGWCSVVEGKLIVQPHPASPCAPVVYPYPSGIEVLGRVAGMATLLHPRKRRRVRAAATPELSPDR